MVYLPLTLAESDGSLKKTAKSQLLHKIEDTAPLAEQLCADHVFIADGIAYVRQINFDLQVIFYQVIKIHCQHSQICRKN